MQTDTTNSTGTRLVSAVDPKPVAAVPDGQRQLLLESVVTDLHFSALQIGLISILLTKCARGSGNWTMYSWRNVCQGDAPSMLLGLRYVEQIAIRQSTAKLIGKLYSDRDKLAGASRNLLSIRQSYDAGQRAAIGHLSVGWCALSADAMRALAALAGDTTGRLAPHYAGNDGAIDGLLKEAISRNTSRVSETGSIELPALTQRRRRPRIEVSKPCTILVSGSKYPATLLDVSRSGAGIACQRRLAENQPLMLILDDAHRIEAKVAWKREERYGIAFAQLLPWFSEFFEQ